MKNATNSLANSATKAVSGTVEAPHYERSDRLDSAAGYLYEAPEYLKLCRDTEQTSWKYRTRWSTFGTSKMLPVWCGASPALFIIITRCHCNFKRIVFVEVGDISIYFLFL